jgi:hypothetical protein
LTVTKYIQHSYIEKDTDDTERTKHIIDEKTIIRFEKEFEATVERSLSSMTINDLNLLILKLNQFADEHDSSIIQKWADEIAYGLETFDMNFIEGKLKDFEEILKLMKQA